MNMMRYLGFAVVAIVVFALTFLAASLAMGCTGVCLQAKDGSIVYARTLEFGADLQSQVLFLPRGYQTVGTTASGNPGLTWKSRYAAVGMNAYDQNVFADGVNEQGLAAGIFYFPGYAGYQKVTPGRRIAVHRPLGTRDLDADQFRHRRRDQGRAAFDQSGGRALRQPG